MRLREVRGTLRWLTTDVTLVAPSTLQGLGAVARNETVEAGEIEQHRGLSLSLSWLNTPLVQSGCSLGTPYGAMQELLVGLVV
jgi:hypothetical protein